MAAGISCCGRDPAISAGSNLYVAADGKVSDAAVGKQIGINLTASTADGGKVSAVVWGPRGGNDMLSARGDNVELFDDFFTYDTTNAWAVVEDAGATGGDKVIDGVGGLLSVGCDGDDNDEVYVSSKLEAFKFAASKMLFFECSVELTEASTDDANKETAIPPETPRNTGTIPVRTSSARSVPGRAPRAIRIPNSARFRSTP